MRACSSCLVSVCIFSCIAVLIEAEENRLVQNLSQLEASQHPDALHVEANCPKPQICPSHETEPQIPIKHRRVIHTND